MKKQLSHKSNRNTVFIAPQPTSLTTVWAGSLGCVGYAEIDDSHSPNRTMPRLNIEDGIKREEAAWITMGKMAAQTLNRPGGVST